MKFAILSLLSVTLLFSCQNNKKDLVSSLPKFELGKSYGPKKVDPSKAISVKEMINQFGTSTKDMPFTFIAPIEEVCSKAGCWINVDKGNGETFMVRFKDHFTIPVRTKLGSKAIVRGVAYSDSISVEMLRHFAEDAGKSKAEIEAITEPKFEMGFEADGIVLVKETK